MTIICYIVIGVNYLSKLGKLKNKILKPLYDRKNNKIISMNSKRLNNNKFTIISNNCWGGCMYAFVDREYQSPFVGLFMIPKEYVKMCYNLKHYLESELTFIDRSKYDIEVDRDDYPIALLDDIEIHFLHYKNKDEALEKWKKRIKRINWDNMFFSFAETKMASKEDIDHFCKLDTNNKICFTANKYSSKYCYQLDKYKNQGYLTSDYIQESKKKFDVVEFLNK